MASTLICTTIFTIIAISSVYSLTCYKCESSESSLCSYGLTRFSFNTVDCKDEGLLFKTGINSCVKYVAQGNDGTEYIARGCIPIVGKACEPIMSSLNIFGGITGGVKNVSCSVCNEDKCNAAPTLMAGVFPSLIGVILAAIVYLF